jgi:hypothetical protein
MCSNISTETTRSNALFIENALGEKLFMSQVMTVIFLSPRSAALALMCSRCEFELETAVIWLFG